MMLNDLLPTLWGTYGISAWGAYSISPQYTDLHGPDAAAIVPVAGCAARVEAGLRIDVRE